MKTPDLIAALAADRVRQPPVGRTLGVALVIALAISLLLYLAAVGPRPGLLDLLGTPRVTFKILWTVALACVATGVLLRMGSPGRRSGAALASLAVVLAALGIAVAVELVLLPSELWAPRWQGSNATWCLRIIPMLSLAPLAGALFVLRRAAPTRPALAGAAAGLVAGALGAALYATHCPDDSPLFVASWYGLAILGVTLLGGCLGSRVLRW